MDAESLTLYAIGIVTVNPCTSRGIVICVPQDGLQWVPWCSALKTNISVPDISRPWDPAASRDNFCAFMNRMADELLVRTESFVPRKYCSKGELIETLYTEIVEMGGRFLHSNYWDVIIEWQLPRIVAELDDGAWKINVVLATALLGNGQPLHQAILAHQVCVRQLSNFNISQTAESGVEY